MKIARHFCRLSVPILLRTAGMKNWRNCLGKHTDDKSLPQTLERRCYQKKILMQSERSKWVDVKKVWQAKGKGGKKTRGKIAGSNQQARAWNTPPYCWFGEGNLREKKVRSIIRSRVRSRDWRCDVVMTTRMLWWQLLLLWWQQGETGKEDRGEKEIKSDQVYRRRWKMK